MAKKKTTKKVKRSSKTQHRKANKARARIPRGYSTPVLKNFVMPNPLHGLSEEQRRKFADDVGQNATETFNATFKELEAIVTKHNPLELLATASFYNLFKTVSPKTDFTKDGPYTQSHIEVLQSICLRHRPRKYKSKSVLHPDLGRILEAVSECSRSFALMRMSPTTTEDDRSKSLELLIEGARATTQMLRNWGSPQHMELVLSELFHPIDRDIASELGVGALDLLKLVQVLGASCSLRAGDFIRRIGEALSKRTLRAMVRAFCRIAGWQQDADKVYELLMSRRDSYRNRRAFLLSYFHGDLQELFLFTAEDCARLGSNGPTVDEWDKVLQSMSLKFGELKNDHPQHLMLQSRIRTKPFISLSSKNYFLPIPGMFHTFSLEIIEDLIKPHGHLKKRYHKRRASYLERKIFQIVSEAFPGCIVHAGTTGISPIDSKEYENDCLAIVGTTALVIEAKSERVDDVARRGGSKTLKDHYKSLVAKPAVQANRFARLLELGQGRTSFRTRGGDTYEVDLSSVRDAICISVTLDAMPTHTLCWQQLLAAGLVEPEHRPAINLSLVDLMVAVEVLATPLIRLHYFKRRLEWEANVEYMADEEDLIVYYLSDGLARPMALDGAEVPTLWLHGNSDQLRRYYMNAWTNPKSKIPPPRRLLTPWWKAILQKVESKLDSRRWQAGAALLDADFQSQEEFERTFKTVVEAVRENGNDSGPNSFISVRQMCGYKTAVAALAYKQLSLDERNSRIVELADTAQAEGARDVVIIGRDVERLGDPYDCLAFVGDAAQHSSG